MSWRLSLMVEQITFTPVESINAPSVVKYINGPKQAKWPRRVVVDSFAVPKLPFEVNSPAFERYTVAVNLRISGKLYLVRDMHTGADVYSHLIKRFVAHQYEVREKASLGFFQRRALMGASFYVVFGEKPVRNNEVPLVDYNIQPGSTLDVSFSLMKGGQALENILLPTYSVVLECEQMLLAELEVQTEDQSVTDLDVLKQGFDNLRRIFGANTHREYWVKLIEDVSLLMYQVSHAQGKVDYTVALVTFVKLRTPGPLFSNRLLSLLTEKYEALFGSLAVQSVDTTFATMRDYLTHYEELKSSPIFTKLYKFGMYALSLSLFEKLGVTFENLRYSKLEAEAIKRKFCMGPDFIHCMMDTVLFLCERGLQCMRTGSLDPLYHSGSSYQDWFDKSMELKRHSQLMSCPEAHGLTLHQYIADLRDQIEKGEAIYKHARRLSNGDKRIVGGILSDLKMLLANETTKREAQKERKAPFSVLLYGGSSIGKSSLTSMLFYQYGKTFNLPTSSEYKYTRNAIDPFWSGFNSSQWCVILDDIAFMNPDKATMGDPTVMEMLQVVNNVPFVPNQADLADKGRTPMKAELVIASTNCEDLNAFHYFQTSLAARRRLPFVIDVSVKPEFAKDEVMLDSSKVQLVDGEWPDYWRYYVKRVVPNGVNRINQQAKLEDVQIFEHTDEFLAWFSSVAKQHESVQKKVAKADKNMAELEICQTCFYLTHKCVCEVVQSTDETFTNWDHEARARQQETAEAAMERERLLKEPPTRWESIKYHFLWYVILLLSSEFWAKYMPAILRSAYVAGFLEEHFVAAPERMKYLREHFRRMGAQVERNIAYTHATLLIVRELAKQYAIYKATHFVVQKFIIPQILKRSQPKKVVEPKTEETVEAPQEAPIVSPTQPVTIVQAGALSSQIGSRPLPKEDERENVWYRDDFEMTTFESSSQTESWNSLDFQRVTNIVLRNCVHLLSTYEGRGSSRPIRAVCLGGHIYMCNNHGLPTGHTLTTQIVSMCGVEGVNGNITVKIAQECILRIPEKDLAFVRIRNLPPRRNIGGLLPLSRVGGVFKGQYLGRTKTGEDFRLNVHAVKPENIILETPEVVFRKEALSGHADEPTIVGDCGSIFLADTGRGPMILGFHFAGAASRNKVVMSPVTNADYIRAVQHFDEPVIQSGTPTLSAPSATQVLGPLHHKSTLRYIEEGTANVYGSLLGFRAAPKTSVRPTVICESIVARGYEVKHGAPVMRGWKPWRNAAVDMVKPVTDIDEGILDKCVSAFTHDILSKLTPDDLAEIHVYDDFTAVNGAQGVAYVDKMNRNTSMGFPWKKSKKHFLQPIPEQHGMSDPVEFTDEIMDRVNSIISTYISGSRCMPVFTGHLKDEATKFSKIESARTRVFCGGAGDWSIVVRKYLLAFVRVLQRNRFIFEAAPGTNAQSLEWEEIFDFLTQFGKDRMVAGDYAAFDKRMPPTVILAAFRIMWNVCKAAGYSEEELRVVWGIAEDTAFPLVDFNGDVVEFFGSNPSGHPLTVIVNCLANSLYIRYCFATIEGVDRLAEFQQLVALMTYGDDNAMGIHKSIPKFNHTSIQEVLASVGITYTMADKETASIPYIHISEVSFLKREWRWDEDVGAMLCPLEEASISKSLTRSVASKTVTPEKQAVDIMSAACREYFFYGRSKFEEKRAMLMEVAEECNLNYYIQDSTFPTWEELKQAFWKNSQHVALPRLQ